jgi:hypothetical protein
VVEAFCAALAPSALAGEMRRARGHISRTEPCRTQAKLESPWTVFGLAQALGGPSPLTVYLYPQWDATHDAPPYID